MQIRTHGVWLRSDKLLEDFRNLVASPRLSSLLAVQQLSYSEKALNLGSGDWLRVSLLLLVIWIDIISSRLNFLSCEMVMILPALPSFYIGCEDQRILLKALRDCSCCSTSSARTLLFDTLTVAILTEKGKCNWTCSLSQEGLETWNGYTKKFLVTPFEPFGEMHRTLN